MNELITTWITASFISKYKYRVILQTQTNFINTQSNKIGFPIGTSEKEEDIIPLWEQYSCQPEYLQG